MHDMGPVLKDWHRDVFTCKKNTSRFLQENRGVVRAQRNSHESAPFSQRDISTGT